MIRERNSEWNIFIILRADRVVCPYLRMNSNNVELKKSAILNISLRWQIKLFHIIH